MREYVNYVEGRKRFGSIYGRDVETGEWDQRAGRR